MKRLLHISFLIALSVLGLTSTSVAQVSVTPASGGTNLSADNAGNATSPQWTTLGNIVITENSKGDFTTPGGTLILTAPTGWEFNSPGSVTTNVTGTNLSVTNVSVSASSITLTLAVSQTNKSDVLTIIGVEVRATDGGSLPASGNILRTSGNPGTASINGITNDVTNFGSLSQIVGVAKQLSIITQPSASANAGVVFAQQPTIEIHDQFGNRRSAANGAADNSTVVTAARSTGTGTLQGTLTATASDGVATFLNLNHTVANAITIAFTSGSLTSVTSGSITIDPAAASKLVFVQQPGTTTAGVAISPSVTVRMQDAYNNNVTSPPANVTMTLSSGTGILSGGGSIATDGSGVATFSGLSIDASGTKNITASASGLTSAVSNAFSINAGAATQVTFVQQPTNAAAGASLSPSVTVQLRDALGNPVSSLGVSIDVSLTSGTGTLSGTASRTTDGTGLATFDDISFDSVGTKQLTASSSGLTPALSSSFDISAGAPASLAFVQQPTDVGAASTITPSITVKLRDQFGNDVQSSGVTIGLALYSGTGTVSGTTSKVTDGAGVATFNDISMNLAGTKSFAASSVGLTSAISSEFVVSPDSAWQVVFIQEPSAVIAGDTIAPPVTVQLRDSTDNNVPTANVSVSLTLASGTGTLSGTVTRLTDSSGLATFDDLSIDQEGDKTLAASSSGLVPDTSSSFSISAVGTPAQLAFSVQPTATASGSAIAAIKVQLQDEFSVNVGQGGVSVTIELHSGTGTLAGTLTQLTNAGGEATFSDVSIARAGTFELRAVSAGLDTAFSDPFDITPGAFSKLQLLMPGESAEPGSAGGKTGTPSSQTAGAGFSVTVNAVDANWNVVPTVTDVIVITSSDANALLPASGGLVAGTQAFTVVFKTAGSATVTATDQTDGGKTPSTSPSTTVNPGSFVKLQLLMPGESAAAGTALGKTGSPIARTAGTAFSVTVNAVDTSWNIVNTETDNIGITSSDVNAALPASAALSSGTQTFSVTLKTAGSATVTATNLTNGLIAPDVSPSTTVNPGAFAKLQLLLPGETAAPGSVSGKTGSPSAVTANSSFNVTVNAVDANWNLVNSVVDIVGIASSDANAALPANDLLVAGTLQFALALNTAGTSTVTASDVSDGGKDQDTSPSVTVNAGSFNRLQVLLPGEIAVPGSSTGKTGTPNTQAVGGQFSFTVNAVDTVWNPVSSTNTIQITSSDGSATLPGNAALVAGSQTFNLTFGTSGAQTITASNVTVPAIYQDISSSITVNAAGNGIVTPATGGSAISADDAGGAYTALTGPVYTETSSGNAGVGTIVLNAPGGFRFDTTGTAPTVLITRLSGGGGSSRNINGVSAPASAAVTSVTSSQITFTVTSASNSGVTNSLTWQNVRVRPTAGAPLATGDLTTDGTSTMTGVTPAVTSFGTLTEVAGAPTDLIITLPGQTFTSGVGNSGSPSGQAAGSGFNLSGLRAVDQFLNTAASYDGSKTISYAGPASTTATYTTSVSFTNGVATTTLTTTLNRAETTTLTATDGSLSGIESDSLIVSAGLFTRLQLLVPGESADPGTATGKTGVPDTAIGGNSFNVTVNAVDDYWNPVSSSDVVGITSSDGTAVLPSNAALAGGTQTFAVTLNSAGSQTITASDITQPSRTADTSPSIEVSAGTFVKLQILLPGETAAPGTPSGKTGTPSAQVAGTPFDVIVNAVDDSWNVVTSVVDVVSLSSSDANATLPTDAALVAGTKTMSITLKTAGSSTITATDVTDGTKTLSPSPTVTVGPGAFTKLQLLVPGESAAPGTASGKSGVPLTQTAGAGFNIQVRAVDADWNLVNTIADVVRITSSDGSAFLPPDGALAAGVQTFSITLNDTTGKTITASDVSQPTKTANTSPVIALNAAGSGTATPATGGTAISADDASSGSWTTLTGPVYTESTPGNVGLGTIILDAPSGFEFDDAGTAPTVLVTRTAGSGDDTLNINKVVSGTQLALTSVTTTQLVLDITSSSTGSVENSLTWQNIRIRPTAGTPLAVDTIFRSGTATMTGVSDTIPKTSFGPLAVLPGAVDGLFITLPGETFTSGSGNTGTPSTQTAGSAFVISSVTAVDQFLNTVTGYSGSKTLSYSGPGGTPTYTTGVVFSNGQNSTTLTTTLKKAETTSITVEDGTTTGPASSSLTVDPGAFTKLQILAPGETEAPGTASGKTGTPSTQAVTVPFNVTVNAVDANWNLVSSTNQISITSTDGAATLPGPANLVGGTQTFSVTFNGAGSQTVTATDDTQGKTPDTTPSITVTAGAFTKLQLLLPGESAAPGTGSGKTGTPDPQTAGTPFNVTVNAVDANWNVIPGVADLVGITSTDTYASLPSNAALVNGTKTFSVTLKSAGNATITATDLDDGLKTPDTSPSVTVNPGAFSKLQILVPGESAVPGSPTGKTGSPSSTTEGIQFSVTVNAVDANWNPVTSTDLVGITSSDGSATLPGNAALVGGTQTYNVTLNTAGGQTVTATDITDGGKTPSTSPSITVNAAGTIQSTTTGGLWSSTGTWIGGVVPTATSNVVIATTGAAAVTIDASVTIRTLNINPGAVLEGDGSAWTLTVGKNNTLSLTNDGTFNANGTSIIVASTSSWDGSGSFNLTSINMNGKTLTIAFAAPDTISLDGAGIPISGGGTLVPGVNSAFRFDGTSAQTIPIGTYTFTHVYASNSAGATIGAAITAGNVAGDVRVLSGSMSNGGFAIAGNGGKTFEVADGATFVLTGTSAFPTTFTASLGVASTVDYQGTSQTIVALDYGHLVLTGGTKTLATSGSIGIAGALTLVTSPTVTTTSSTVDYNGTGAQSINSSVTYNHLQVSGSADTSVHKTPSGNLTVGGDLTIAANASIDMAGFTLSAVGGGSDNAGKLMWPATNSVVVPGAGTTEFYGTSAGTVTAGAYGNLWFTGSGVKTISGIVTATGGTAAFGVTVTNNLTVSVTGDLTITGMDLNVDGNITNDGVITVE